MVRRQQRRRPRQRVSNTGARLRYLTRAVRRTPFSTRIPNDPPALSLAKQLTFTVEMNVYYLKGTAKVDKIWMPWDDESYTCVGLEKSGCFLDIGYNNHDLGKAFQRGLGCQISDPPTGFLVSLDKVSVWGPPPPNDSRALRIKVTNGDEDFVAQDIGTPTRRSRLSVSFANRSWLQLATAANSWNNIQLRLGTPSFTYGTEPAPDRTLMAIMHLTVTGRRDISSIS